MTLEEAIVQLLKTGPAIAGLSADRVNARAALAGLVQDRVYPMKLPQNPTYPSIVYTVIATDPDTTQEGPSGYCKTLYQFDVFSPAASTGKQVTDAVRWLLAGLKATLGTGTVEVFACFRTDERAFYNDDFEIYVRQSDFEIHFAEQRSIS